MKESDIRKNIATGHHHGKEHEIIGADEHSQGGHVHPASESIDETEEHDQHHEEQTPKERDTTMRDKIAATLISVAVLVIIGFGSAPNSSAASIRIDETVAIRQSVIAPNIVTVINQNAIASARIGNSNVDNILKGDANAIVRIDAIYAEINAITKDDIELISIIKPCDEGIRGILYNSIEARISNTEQRI